MRTWMWSSAESAESAAGKTNTHQPKGHLSHSIPNLTQFKMIGVHLLLLFPPEASAQLLLHQCTACCHHRLYIKMEDISVALWWLVPVHVLSSSSIISSRTANSRWELKINVPQRWLLSFLVVLIMHVEVLMFKNGVELLRSRLCADYIGVIFT